ncbi:MAG: cytochrome C oxidase subunit IV family protein [Acidimicrobiia bacterium]|nr:cytochrome C oxidase subunit IV family protein [Acidimicrobiia bacterium]MDH3463456.1 cytochrome C oxidase subunit IV family protein [Acidimicrobiia bacterium]
MSNEHAHPTPASYWKIAVVLAVLTAIEVALYYIDRELELGSLNALILILLALAKFVIVVGWYMHLKYEKRIANSFFVAGFLLAIGLYGVVLASLGVLVIRGG